MNTGNQLRDTMLGLQKAQMDRERRLRSNERAAAREIVEEHAETEQWPEEDLEQVIGMLGLDNDAR